MFRNLKGKGNGDFTIKIECIKVNVNARDKSEANLFRRRFLFPFGSGWCRGLWNTPRRDPKEFRIFRVLVHTPLAIGLPVDRHLRGAATYDATNPNARRNKRIQKNGLRTSQVSMR